MNINKVRGRNSLVHFQNMRPGRYDGSVLQTSRRGRSGRVSTLKTPSKSLAHYRRRMRSCSYSKVEDDVPVTIHLDNVLEFRVGDSGDGVGERCRKFQREADASLTHETEMVPLRRDPR